MSKKKSKNYFHCGLWWTNGARSHVRTILLLIVIITLFFSNKNKNTTEQQNKRDTDKTV